MQIEEALNYLPKALLAIWYGSMVEGSLFDGAGGCPALGFTMADLTVLSFITKSSN